MIIALASLFLFAVIIAGLPYIYAAWRRIGEREADLQLWRVMTRRGIDADQRATHAQLAGAIRRCVLCPSIERCDRWLAENEQDALEEFCPNAALFAGRNSPGK
jgi:hypothetical protein